MNPENMPENNVDSRRVGTQKDIVRAGEVLSTSETVNRYGSANAEYIKGYTGIDNESGQQFAKSLNGISHSKVNANPVEAAKNIKQQAGYSAEVATTSRDNAEAIIDGSKVRTTRSDDLPQYYHRNDTVVDRVRILDGQIIEGSQSQMKFVGNRDQLFNRIAREDGKFARYRGTKLELPSEQYDGAAQHCKEQAEQLRLNAERAAQSGKPDVAAKLRREAGNYDQLANDVRDSGMTTEQAIFYREHPAIATALDMARTSHRAGVEGAQYSAAIGGAISLLQNIFALAQDKKNMETAAVDLTVDTAQAAVIGYGTAAAGSAIKSAMQQSGKETIRALAGTSVPALAVTVCISLGSSIKRYATGEITELQLLVEVGQKGAGMLSAGMMAGLGQLAMPVPFVGAAIGGMIGYALSSLFYQSALDAARGAECSREMLMRTRAIQTAARARIAQEQAVLDAFLRREIPELTQETHQLFAQMNDVACNAETLAVAVSRYATLLGKKLQFQSLQEFDDFIRSDKSFLL